MTTLCQLSNFRVPLRISFSADMLDNDCTRHAWFVILVEEMGGNSLTIDPSESMYVIHLPQISSTTPMHPTFQSPKHIAHNGSAYLMLLSTANIDCVSGIGTAPAAGSHWAFDNTAC